MGDKQLASLTLGRWMSFPEAPWYCLFLTVPPLDDAPQEASVEVAKMPQLALGTWVELWGPELEEGALLAQLRPGPKAVSPFL